jgi:hypothetical protein
MKNKDLSCSYSQINGSIITALIKIKLLYIAMMIICAPKEMRTDDSLKFMKY